MQNYDNQEKKLKHVDKFFINVNIDTTILNGIKQLSYPVNLPPLLDKQINYMKIKYVSMIILPGTAQGNYLIKSSVVADSDKNLFGFSTPEIDNIIGWLSNILQTDNFINVTTPLSGTIYLDVALPTLNPDDNLIANLVICVECYKLI